MPLWFQSAIQEGLKLLWLESNVVLNCVSFSEKGSAFEAMFSGADRTKIPGYMDWDDKYHFKRGLENQHLYIQGLRDRVQLAFTLLVDSISDSDKR